MRRFMVPLVMVMLLTTGCGKNAPPSPSPPAGGGDTITGRERLGWDQPASGAAELATFRYAIYVDGARSEISETACSAGAGTAGFACSGRLPTLANGPHTLELATFLADGTESARSAPLLVTVSAIQAGDSLPPWESGVIEAPGARPVQLERLAGDLDGPIDAAATPDGRIIIVERSGRVLLIPVERRRSDSSAPIDAVRRGSPDHVVSIAVDPEFARTRFVFAVQAEVSAHSTVYSVSRFRELGGILAQRAVIFETRVNSPPGASSGGGVIRFGPDGKIYVALEHGSLLRLNPDGSIPSEQSPTRAIAAGIQAPRGLGWHPDSGLMWIADEARADGGAEAIGHMSGVDVGGNPLLTTVRARHEIQDGMRSMAFSGNAAFVASTRGRYILRLEFSAGDPGRIAASERWLEDRVGVVRLVFTGPDGALYFCTEDGVGRVRQ